MRGGSIPLLAWGTLLLVLFIGNAVWNGKPVDSFVAAFAALVIYLGAALIAASSGRQALRRGPPPADTGLHPLPEASTGAVLVALGTASFVLGFTFGRFLVYFGVALAVLGLARLVVELRAERATLREAQRTRHERPGRRPPTVQRTRDERPVGTASAPERER